MNNIRTLIDCFSALYPISLFEFDKDGRFLWTDNQDARFMGSSVFAGLGKLAVRYAYAYSRPSIVAGDYQCMWIVDSVRTSQIPDKIYVVGPFFMDSYPGSEINSTIRNAGLSSPEKRILLEQLPKISVIPFSNVLYCSVMIHYAITGEKISITDLHHEDYQRPAVPEQNEEDTTYHGTYDAEREMLNMVRNGDRGIFEYLQNFAISNVGTLANIDSEPLRQLKNTSLAGIILFSRAAIEGGLYPDTALTLTDRYFQAVEACRSFQEIGAVTRMMQEDFVNRVHKIRHQQKYTKPVQAMVDYIELHIEEEIRLEEISKELGYTDYYLTRKFKNEVGVSLKQYIRNNRLERAAFLIRAPGASVKEVSERLHFASESYFIDCFRKRYEMTPRAYQQSF